jgi:hypothetical protein
VQKNENHKYTVGTMSIDTILTHIYIFLLHYLGFSFPADTWITHICKYMHMIYRNKQNYLFETCIPDACEIKWRKRTNKHLQNTMHTTKDRVTGTPLSCRYSGRVGNSLSCPFCICCYHFSIRFWHCSHCVFVVFHFICTLHLLLFF